MGQKKQELLQNHKVDTCKSMWLKYNEGREVRHNQVSLVCLMTLRLRDQSVADPAAGWGPEKHEIYLFYDLFLQG